MGQTEAGNLMNAFHAEDAKAATKLEDKNFKKGFLGYRGGLKAGIEDTTSAILLGQSMEGLAENAESILDKRTYTEAGRKEQYLEAAKEEAIKVKETRQFLKDEGLLDDSAISDVYDNAKNSLIQNYDTTFKNISSKLNSNVLTNPSSGQTTPIVKSITPTDVTKVADNNNNYVVIPTLINGRIVQKSINWLSQAFSNNRNPK